MKMESENICKPLHNPKIKCCLKTIIENRSAIELPELWHFSYNATSTLLVCAAIKLEDNNVKSSKSVVLSEDENSTIKINILLNGQIVNIPFISKSIANIEELKMVLKVVDSLKLCKCFHINKNKTCLLHSLEFNICRPCKDLKLEPTKTVIDDNFTNPNASNVNKINDIRCSLCNKSVTTLSDLQKHQHGHLPKYNEKHFECTICDVSFEEANMLVEHYGKLHRGFRFIKCTLCTETFNSAKYLRMHMRLHRNSMKYCCQHCDSEFLNNNIFLNHTCKVEVQSKCYVCNICSVKFSTNHLLIQHQREHQICISLKCYICNKIFITKEELSEHKIHCKQKRLRFVCNICNIRFSCISQKASHMSTMHIGNEL